MAVTITDIAAKAGVSRSMVSRALTGSGPVKPQKKEEIIALARAMGYAPNQAALHLRHAKSYMIGLYFSTISQSTSPYVLHSVLTGAYSAIEKRYQIAVKGIDQHEAGSLNPSQYDGLLIMSQWDMDLDFLEEAASLEIPMVAISRRVPIDIPVVTTDEQGGMKDAMSYLLDCGHRHIGIIEGPPNLEATLLRHFGWIQAVKEHGLSHDQFPVAYGNYRYRSGYQAANQLMNQHPGLTALLCFNDEMAVGAKNALARRGLQVPKDVSLIGYDNLELPRYADLQLTSVERNAYQIAVEGARMLMHYIEDGVRPPDLELKNRLVIRESVKTQNLYVKSP
ncbi:MAG: LacI family DNA-binding transcriptional regulator [Lachnospiraceae bacterium]|nr:LacI family DNA-binding transcriptional regulator [Lachnospiraceae bacterium]